jgi:hypothetical protein
MASGRPRCVARDCFFCQLLPPSINFVLHAQVPFCSRCPRAGPYLLTLSLPDGRRIHYGSMPERVSGVSNDSTLLFLFLFMHQVRHISYQLVNQQLANPIEELLFRYQQQQHDAAPTPPPLTLPFLLRMFGLAIVLRVLPIARSPLPGPFFLLVLL